MQILSKTVEANNKHLVIFDLEEILLLNINTL